MISYQNKCWFSTQIPKNPTDIQIPQPVRKNETTEQQKARLLYQSRKRGMLENGLLFSTFADKHLEKLNAELLNQYDKLINEPSNDWDIYYWLTGKEEPPAQFKNEVFEMLKTHTQNKSHEQRFRQPDIRFS
ncbi:hypothetical protein V9T40_006096 [Parthenolecanium corni]|uniref:Succinate dehydrogenase assembly factor 2, mitochondrial n=1 Tax=Parthenolecanium corni TaxID=536013 RepID=A0AAN9YBK3_9HEMI